jgi:hypothetical protein
VSRVPSTAPPPASSIAVKEPRWLVGNASNSAESLRFVTRGRRGAPTADVGVVFGGLRQRAIRYLRGEGGSKAGNTPSTLTDVNER